VTGEDSPRRAASAFGGTGSSHYGNPKNEKRNAKHKARASFLPSCSFVPFCLRGESRFKMLQGFPSRKVENTSRFPITPSPRKTLEGFREPSGSLVKPSGVWSNGHEA